MVSKRVQVEIAGMTFQVVGDDDADYIKNLAKDANRRIAEIERNNYRLNDVQVYILTLLNALDEMQKMEKSQREADALSEDAGALKDKLAEIESLKRRLEQSREDGAADKEKIEAASARVTELETEEKELRKALDESVRKNEHLDGSLAEKDRKIKELEEKNYESQMRIVDLNKEIYVLRGEDEQK